ncbi:hypothetical protein BO86DRAFT_383627 [Aspergillus japonicus CBS 114.51]|uniref:Uncharacterized protein n=1 Tax=Aspergillus japonicus CBS 114.51 TaxID=1448312 RepID=A0A8T8WM08_ASPJA|nr:hypothetical protein BO86DRAFT_383627 [Aspergillus japonicus CBS 114.51]RAH76682.1 hypothetical protein BO86DRAFT_383627 [Aspergillus japonicus CBS 114.51]
MQQDWLTTREVHVATERRLKYQALERLKIDKLKQTWKEDGCRRLDAENYIPALASSEAISQALARIGMTPECFKNNRTNHLPSMTFDPNQIKGLHGRHRIYAAADFLAPADKWWVVDIYLDDVDDALRDHLVEEYDLNREHTDGYIYRKIRQFDDDHAIGTRWKAHLSSSNRQRWEQIINNNWLRKAFDELLDIPGLWIDGMRLSMVHRLVAISCPEEICAYLNHVHRFWSSLVNDDTDAKKCIDQKTIKKLELLAPGTSPDDAKSAQQVILTGQVFPDFDEDRRTEIWDRLKGFKGLIPSLRTFFEDFKYLESCAYCLKRLVGPSEVSIHQALKQIFIVASDTTNDYLIQIAEYEYRKVHMVSAQQFNFAYCQLWLYAMRHYPLMPPDPKKQNHHLAKPKLAPADQHAIYNMAQLAHRLGFRSTEVNTIIDASPDHQIARTALLQARKPDRYRYDADTFESLIDRLVECFATARPACETATQPTLSKPVKAQARCGLPKLQAQEHDKSTLFLPSFIDEFPKTNHVTSWFVRRCVFGAFLGANLTPLEDGFQNILSGLLISPSPRTANPLFPQIETLRSGPSLDGLETSTLQHHRLSLSNRWISTQKSGTLKSRITNTNFERKIKISMSS